MKHLLFALSMILIGSDVSANITAFDWEQGTKILVESDGAKAGDVVNYYNFATKGYTRARIEYGEDQTLVICDVEGDHCRELEVEDWD